MNETKLIDCHGRSIFLDQQLGRGGEGNALAVRGDQSLAAKLYHKRPLAPERVAKLEAMVARASPALAAVAAWPISLLYDAQTREPRGLLMPRISNAYQLHELYSTINRRRHFPDAQWQHLILAARNLAAAFDSVHDHDIIVGDVNQGNLLVDRQMCVRFIDCDSFQVKCGDSTFTCPVGTPHFTPPELQSARFDEIVRSTHHDCFGLAILIFHLLFVGRHPFAGRFRGDRDLAIEQAITERRYAFSRDTEATLMEPPPASLTRHEISPQVAELFEAAFRGDGQRPQAWKWVEALDELLQHRRSCRFDASHIYYRSLDICPWCRMEGMGGPSLFLAFNLASTISTDRLGDLEGRIKQFNAIRFAEVPTQRLSAPTRPPREKPPARTGLSTPDFATFVLIAVLPLVLGGFVVPPLLLAGAAVALIAGGCLLLGRAAHERREKVTALRLRLNSLNKRLSAKANRLVSDHQERAAVFEGARKEFQQQVKAYRAEGRQLEDVLREFEKEEYRSQRSEYLSGYLLRDNVGKIRGLTHSAVSMLQSYGVESAMELEKHMMYGIPNVTSSIAMELLHWRADLESRFKFKPTFGTASSAMQLDQPLVRQGVKIFQAQRILNLGKRLNLLAQSGEGELSQSLASFDDTAAQWKRAYTNLDEFQSGRNLLERAVNRSMVVLLGVTTGLPIFLLGLYWLIR